MFFSKVKKVSSTPFSDFIRKASSEEKKRLYTRVLKKASESQNRVLAKAASSK
jgi:type III secretory pathway component EscR